jgi:hypothetical protein
VAYSFAHHGLRDSMLWMVLGMFLTLKHDAPNSIRARDRPILGALDPPGAPQSTQF